MNHLNVIMGTVALATSFSLHGKNISQPSFDFSSGGEFIKVMPSASTYYDSSFWVISKNHVVEDGVIELNVAGSIPTLIGGANKIDFEWF